MKHKRKMIALTLIASLLLAGMIVTACSSEEDPKNTTGSVPVEVITPPGTEETEASSTAQTSSTPPATVTEPEPSSDAETTLPTTKPETKPTEPPATTAPAPTTAPTESEEPTVQESKSIVPMEYPQSAVQTLEERGITLGSFSYRGAGESTYAGNRHYTGTHVIVSPYYTATVDDIELPVYATVVYVATDNHGAIHSFASVDVDLEKEGSVTFTLKVGKDVPVSSVQVYAHDPAEATCSGQKISLKVSKHGMYTIVLNDEQDHAITLMVRQYRDEEAEIADYIQQYGKDNVLVYETGLHEIDYLNLKSNTVLYLRSGAILMPKHTFDIMNDDAAANTSESQASQTNGIGLNRFPVINAYSKRNVVIAGRGTVDMTQLDWHERRGIVFTMCKNITMDGVIIVNPCEWAFITYRCENVKVTQSAVLGYRTNSDAFAICNTIDAQITDCFARTGDDMFEVKTLGGVDGAVSKDITYSRCQAWGSKARCFGVIGEIEKDVSNILFEDGIVIFRDAIWDNNRIGSLVVLRECGNGTVNGVTFRNITIHYDAGRAIQVGNYGSNLTDSRMVNICFENVTYNAKMNSQVRINVGQGNELEIVLKNVTANGTLLTKRNAVNFIYWDKDDTIKFQ